MKYMKINIIKYILCIPFRCEELYIFEGDADLSSAIYNSKDHEIESIEMPEEQGNIVVIQRSNIYEYLKKNQFYSTLQVLRITNRI